MQTSNAWGFTFLFFMMTVAGVLLIVFARHIPEIVARGYGALGEVDVSPFRVWTYRIAGIVLIIGSIIFTIMVWTR